MAQILVVDDEYDIAMSLKLGLQRNGYSVDIYSDPLEALQSYSPGVYDLLLIDLRMPRMNGLELAQEIRNRDPDALVWFVTAFEVYSEEFAKAYPHEEDLVFIRKPISLAEVKGKLAAQFNSKKELVKIWSPSR